MSRKIYRKKYFEWDGRCGGYAKAHGYDKTLKRYNEIRDFYFEMWTGLKYQYHA